MRLEGLTGQTNSRLAVFLYQCASFVPVCVLGGAVAVFVPRLSYFSYNVEKEYRTYWGVLYWWLPPVVYHQSIQVGMDLNIMVVYKPTSIFCK